MLISATRFAELKAKVKAECQRRAHTGSVASYAEADYDYTDTAEAGVIIKKEHYEKNAVPLNAISGAVGVTANIISDAGITALEEEVDRLAAISATASSSGCAASCTGLCQGGCATGCSGCSGSCSGCSGSCSGGCKGSGGTTTCTDGCRGSVRSTCGD